MSCTVERRVVPELERKLDLRRCSLRARGPPTRPAEPTSSVCSSHADISRCHILCNLGRPDPTPADRQRQQYNTPHDY